MTELPEQLRRQKEAIEAHFQNPPDADGDTGENQNPAPNAENGSESQNPPAPQQADDGFAQKYYTLQGMHRADVQRFTAQLNEAQARIQQLETLLSSIPPAPQVPEPSRQETRRLISEQEQQEYGESLDVMRKVTREELSAVDSRFQQLEAALNNISHNVNTVIPQVQQVSRSQAETVQQGFWRELEDAVPNWRAVNVDPDWQSWLLAVDPLYGNTRQSLLDAAQQNWDHNRVIAFFHTFMNSHPKYRTNNPTQTARSSQTAELQAQVAPGRPRSTSAPTGQQGKTYTRAEIARFFDDVRQGKYKGQESERNRIERDIFAATSEGRVVA